MFLTSALLADFLTYVKDNLILMILCVVCLAAIVAILVILAVTAKQARKNRAAAQNTPSAEENPSEHDSLPEELPQVAEEPVKETHDVPPPAVEAPVAETTEDKNDDNAEQTEQTEKKEETVTESEPVTEPNEEVKDTDKDTVVIVEPPKKAAEEKAEEPKEVKENSADEKPRQTRKKIVVTTRHAEKTEKAEKAEKEEPVQEVIEIVPAPKAEEEQGEVVEIVPPPKHAEETSEQGAEEQATESAEAKEEESIAAAESVSNGETTEKKKPQYAGKWVFNEVVTVDAAGEEKEKNFFFRLKASNGETLIFSEEYTSLRGANQGVDTFKANIAKDNFKITVSKKGKYVIKLLNGQGSLLAQGAHYNNRAAAQSGVASIKRFAATAVKQDDVQIITMPYEEVTESAKDYDPDKKGKWVIRRAVSEDGAEESYYFELRASNGQLLFTSEEYTSLNGAKVGIGTHKANIASGNVRSVITRNGDYVLKIYAGNGQLLCLGEHYSTRQLCQSAVESVKRFAETAEIVEETAQEE